MDQPDHSAEKPVELTVSDAASGERIDRFLAGSTEIDLTRSRAQKLIESGSVLVNNEQVTKKHKMHAGDLIVVYVPPLPPTEIVGEDIPIDIVYEDEHLAIVNKAAGLVTHPGVGNRSGTLVNALVHRFGALSKGSAPSRPGIVHRLDKNTSGLLVVAKNDKVHLHLQNQMRQRRIKRRYLALVCGHMHSDSGTVEEPIGRSAKDRMKMMVTSSGGREATTRWELVDRYRLYDLLHLSLQTGRTHQIRVHMAHLKHPVFGDPQYGGREKWHRGVFAPERPLSKKLLTVMNRQALLAQRLELVHPVTKEKMTFEVDPPPDFQQLLEILDDEGR